MRRVTHKRNAHRQARTVWRKNFGEIEPGLHVHHVNGDPFDNRVENLELLTAREHAARHPHKRPVADHVLALAAEWHRSDAGRAWHREHGKRTWAAREPVDRLCDSCQRNYETFFPARSRFCSNACKARALRQRRRAERES